MKNLSHKYDDLIRFYLLHKFCLMKRGWFFLQTCLRNLTNWSKLFIWHKISTLSKKCDTWNLDSSSSFCFEAFSTEFSERKERKEFPLVCKITRTSAEESGFEVSSSWRVYFQLAITSEGKMCSLKCWFKTKHKKTFNQSKTFNRRA